MALQARNLALADEIQRARILSREKFERDQVAYISEAEERGRLEGKLEGKLEGLRHVALNLLQLGMDPQTIIATTGLTGEEMNLLQNTPDASTINPV